MQLAVKEKGAGDVALLQQLVNENKANKITVESLKPLFKVTIVDTPYLVH